MNEIDLIGKVATEYIKSNLNIDSDSEGLARFLLDRLTGKQVARICEEILEDTELSSYIEIKVPSKLVEDYDLPKSIITDEKTTFWRHAPIDKPAIILANTNDDQGQSLRDITTIGARDLKGNPEIWVNIASAGLALTEEQKKCWKQAINGLQEITDFSLERFSLYVVRVRDKIQQDSVPLITALGWALPSLRIPRDSALFEAIPDKFLGHKKRWADLYQSAIAKRSCYIFKQYPNREIIENEDLESSYNKVKEDIPEHVRPVIERFIQAKPGWTKEAEALTDFEWERENIHTFFSGIQKKKVDLGTQTLEHLEDEHSDTMSEEDIDYLETLSKRTASEPTEEDIEFYESHRQELESNRSLKSKWDKFVYGKPIECEDFIIGLLEAVERLFSQSENTVSKKKIRIRTQKRNSKSSWLDLNSKIGLFFSTRYKGLERLTYPNIIWDVHWLFKYEELLEEVKNKPKYKKNTSVSKNATQIKFYVELEYVDESNPSHQVQVIWKGDPNKIGLELKNDLERIEKNPFPLCRVSKNPISKKGKLQGISLNDVGTLHAVYHQNRGSLVGVYNSSNDIGKQFMSRLKTAFNEKRLSQQGFEEINKAWERFSNLYKESIKEYLQVGLSSETLILQCNAYEGLLNALSQYASSDINRVDLWQPILNIGNVQVDGNQPMSIIAPWHPMRFASLAVKAIQFDSIVRSILESEEVDFGDSKLYFSDLKRDFMAPYYPEVSYGYRGKEPELLSITDNANEYSLMEMPVKKFDEQETNEDPKEASTKVSNLVQKYIELQPHESTNLGVVLYNCDSTRLPKAIVDSISSLRDKYDDIRCQVVLRHRNMDKLSELYTKMVENTDDNSDSFVASELSRDFMARLRIGVMADTVPVNEINDEKPSDIVFMQEVISREAKFVWSPVRKGTAQELLEHRPPRWSRRRPSVKDELKSTSYLVCPSQPSVGWSYLNVLRGVCGGIENEQQDTHYLPSRQISFQNEDTRSIFDEAHKLGEWVANYDELLDQRLLKNQGINVIKYQHNQSNGPNLVVSTKSQLNLLQILVKRRLSNLNLGLSDEELYKLSEIFIEEANDLSGDIVLRAAKQGKFASELLGVVLSKLLIKSELGVPQAVGWFFLDDYASWLGKKEEQIADILALYPKEENGEHYLQVIITECKYVDIKGLANAKKTSKKQLSDTVMRINSALFGSPSRLDRDLWLARISDMLVEGVEFSQDTNLSLEQWREGIRKGDIPIDLRGYSHVFVSSSSDDSNLDCEQLQLNNLENCFQEVYNREKVRELTLAIFKQESLIDIRQEIGDERPWESLKAIIPSDEVSPESKRSRNVDRITTATEDNEKKPNEYGSGESFYPKEQNEDSDLVIDKRNKNESIPRKNDQSNNTFWSGSLLKQWLENKEITYTTNDEDEKWLKDTVKKLKTALMSYNLQAKVIDSRLTPNSAIIRLKGSDKLKVEDIERKRSQLLTTHALGVLNVMANPGEIVVFIARPERQVIYLRDLWKRRKVEQVMTGMNMNFIIGVKEGDGDLLYLNLGGGFEGLQQHAPHTLIAGATGSGKSILLQNLILDICATNSKEMAQVYLIDPKFGVDYQGLEPLPHLIEGIIIDQEKATTVLESLVEKMEERYLIFREYKVPNIKEYNKKAPEDKKMPLIFLIHDEFADWMLVEEYKNTVSNSVQRLGVKARAAGIHLIFAAQRPDKDALPIQLRDNLGNRLILKVESSGTSEIALGEKGAERLLNNGHLAARLSGESNLIHAQVPFLSSEDAIEVVDVIKEEEENH